MQPINRTLLLVDTTEYTCKTAATAETEIWNTAHKSIEDKLGQEREQNRRKLDRVIQRFKDKRDKLKAEVRKVQQEKNQLAKENDSFHIMTLENEKKNWEKTLSIHHRASERNDRMQTSADRLRERIDMLEKERCGWIDERSKLMFTLWDFRHKLSDKRRPRTIFTTHYLHHPKS
jgi:chromosome segregation ATPase